MGKHTGNINERNTLFQAHIMSSECPLFYAASSVVYPLVYAVNNVVYPLVYAASNVVYDQCVAV